MNDRIDKQNSIVNRIVDGSVKIDSVAEFENLLKAFPKDPWLHRAFADLLKREKSFYVAADTYRTSAELFIEADMTLQSIVSKIHEWRIFKPSYQEGEAFYSALHKSKETGIPRFFIKMTHPEIIAFMKELMPRHFPPGSIMKKFGDEENNLYFVVSGALEETIYHRIEKGGRVQKETTKNLVENDFFGEIYPFEEENVSRSAIETITRIEFAKISKSSLMTICRKYPNVKPLVEGLYESRSGSDKKGLLRTVRKRVRHQLPTQVNLKIFPDEPGKAPLDVDGFTEDISLDGARVVLSEDFESGHLDTLLVKMLKFRYIYQLHLGVSLFWAGLPGANRFLSQEKQLQ